MSGIGHGAEALPAPIAGRRRRQRWLEYKRPIPWTWSLVLGTAVWVIFFSLWETAVARGWVNALFMPPPHDVIRTLYRMIVYQGFLGDIGASIYRIVASFLLASAVAVLMHTRLDTSHVRPRRASIAAASR